MIQQSTERGAENSLIDTAERGAIVVQLNKARLKRMTEEDRYGIIIVGAEADEHRIEPAAVIRIYLHDSHGI